MPQHNRTWQDAVEAQLSDTERADARRTRQWIVRGAVVLGVVLLAWIGVVILGFT